MWTLYEPVHAVTYFAPEARRAWEAAGLRGFWRGYFAGRTAPLGAQDAPVVIATYFNFAPSFVRRALPSVWELITPAQALAAREAGAVAAIRRLVGCRAGEPASESLQLAAGLLVGVVADLDWAGRPIGGPNAALPVPADPVARLWRAATVLREHRGDGHVAALVAAGLDGCEALALRVAVDAAQADEDLAGSGPAKSSQAGPLVGRDQFLAIRGWTEAEWEQAADRLRDRGWLAADGRATSAGLTAHQAVEQATDLAAARPWSRLGAAGTDDLAAALAPLAAACAAEIPYPSPIGVPPPVAVAPADAASGAAAGGVASEAAAGGVAPAAAAGS
jgi:hypothetical protein